MKIKLITSALGLVPCCLFSQTIIGSTGFYDPEFKVRRNGQTSGLLSLTVTNTNTSNSQGNGTTTWNHTAGGHAQVRTTLIGVANLDAQLAAFTETSGDSLIFGREITTDASFLFGAVDVSSQLQGLANQVVGASVIYNWQSQAAVTGLAIAPNQLYNVSFEVTSGAGLPVDLLTASTFGITNASVSGASNESSTLLNLANLVTLGAGSDTGTFNFQFKSSQALSQLDFAFAATSGVGVSALGGTAGNQNVLTFSGFEVTQVPEPSASALTCASALLLLTRREKKA